MEDNENRRKSWRDVILSGKHTQRQLTYKSSVKTEISKVMVGH